MALANGTDNGIKIKPGDQIALGESVTQGDRYEGNGLSGFPAIFGLDGFYPYRDYAEQLLPPKPKYWSKERDRVLASTVDYEDFWSGAVGIAITKAGSQSWEITSTKDVALQVKRAQELFHGANAGEGWGHFISQHLQDFLCTDNGAFIEIDRVDNSKPGSKIIGFYHLDSMRCYRTGNPDTPVMYMDLQGQYHLLAWWQVFSIADMPNTRSNYFGVGRCAAGRAYGRIRRMVATELYLYEKVSGGKPQELNFLGGINDIQLKNILMTNEAERKRQGLIVYGGAAFVAMMTKDTISHVSVPVASTHETFNPETELDQALLAYANAIGLDVQELRELKTGGALGTGAQSRIMDEKQDGKGLAFWRKRFEHLINYNTLPSTVVFNFTENDIRDKKLKADLFTSWAGGVTTAVEKGVIDAKQGLQKMVDEDQLPKEFMPQDMTPGLSLDDGEKYEEQLATEPDSIEDLVSEVDNIDLASVLPGGGGTNAN